MRIESLDMPVATVDLDAVDRRLGRMQACGCTNMHDEVVVHRAGRIVGFWPVVARGKLR